jgi:hypothetical protein
MDLVEDRWGLENRQGESESCVPAGSSKVRSIGLRDRSTQSRSRNVSSFRSAHGGAKQWGGIYFSGGKPKRGDRHTCQHPERSARRPCHADLAMLVRLQSTLGAKVQSQRWNCNE